MNKFDPFGGVFDDDPADVSSDGRPDFDPAGDGQDSYKWGGLYYPRVTSILNLAKGSSTHLDHWHAKQAAMAAAAPLVHAGLYTPGADDALEDFVEAQPMRQLDAHAAIMEAANWRSNMREGDRYRDHKSRIGRLVHHASYHFALGTPVAESDRIDWFKATAIDLQLLTPVVLQRYDELGKSPESVLTDLAYEALPYWQNKRAWYEMFKPDHEMVGLGMAAFSESSGYAGTPDEDYWLSQRHYEAAGLRWPFGKPRARILSDDKTTNRKRIKLHALQVAAYAQADFFGSYADHSQHAIPQYDGICPLYIPPTLGEKCDAWLFVGEEVQCELADGFFALNQVYRLLNNMPRANRAVKFTVRKEKKGERTCPIQIGGNAP